MNERFVGTNVELSTDGGGTWAVIGTMVGPFNGTATEEVTRIAVDAVFPSGSFSISGTLIIEEWNHPLEALLWGAIRAVEPMGVRGPDNKPWLKRKKGRPGHGY